MVAVNIVEVGPRDGLQNIPTAVPFEMKLDLLKRLKDAGLQSIELTSAVSPKAIPQLRDCRQVMSSPLIQDTLRNRPEIRLPVLVPNSKGLQVAIEQGIKEIAVFVSATEGFSRANINCSVAEGLQRAKEVATAAKLNGLAVRGSINSSRCRQLTPISYVSCIFADPYTGPTSPSTVYDAVKALADMGCYQISLGDTLGVGVPAQVRGLLKFLFSRGVDPRLIAGHFHDTYGQALANIWEAYQQGVRTFDSSVGGLGGCPFAAGAKGNVATEDVVYMFHQAGIDTGVDLDQLVSIGSWISQSLKKHNDSRAGAALVAKSSKPRSSTNPTQRMKWTPVAHSLEHVIVYRFGANGKIVLNEPQKGNALSLSLISELDRAFRELEADDSIARIIITATGKYFCTGMDLLGGNGTSGSHSKAIFNALGALFKTIDASSKVTVACINGPAFGGGIGLAFSCDLRVSLHSAAFTLSEVRLGLCPAVISKYVLREWGPALTREAMLTGRIVTSQELKNQGIISMLSSTQEGLEEDLEQMLGRLRYASPGGSRMSKELVKVGWKSPDSLVQEETIGRLFEAMMQPDAESALGIAEFRKKRSVDWDQRLDAAKAKL
ncbi:3-hydroxymethyl-3-methylglutaryl-CoA lyase [Rhexocercosporidium sp. MPI-PUGE-AT-0058]|nr:3-hydroxymethyl-3-methylglutaryl-CoA lyase [Rhexocercosporidium sp. MPI-PUGE-AT-0058]